VHTHLDGGIKGGLLEHEMRTSRVPAVAHHKIAESGIRAFPR
jgi:hypothetical protein